MDKKGKFIIIVFIVILVILVLNIVFSIYELSDYEARKEAGNQRWLQVENRILEIEEDVVLLKEEIDQWSR